jgi:hypothetical protein
VTDFPIARLKMKGYALGEETACEGSALPLS